MTVADFSLCIISGCCYVTVAEVSLFAIAGFCYVTVADSSLSWVLLCDCGRLFPFVP